MVAVAAAAVVLEAEELVVVAWVAVAKVAVVMEAAAMEVVAKAMV